MGIVTDGVESTFSLIAGENTIQFRNAGSADNPDMDYLEIVPLTTTTLTFTNRVLNHAILTSEPSSVAAVKDLVDAYEVEYGISDPAKYWGGAAVDSATVQQFWALMR